MPGSHSDGSGIGLRRCKAAGGGVVDVATLLQEQNHLLGTLAGVLAHLCGAECQAWMWTPAWAPYLQHRCLHLWACGKRTGWKGCSYLFLLPGPALSLPPNSINLTSINPTWHRVVTLAASGLHVPSHNVCKSVVAMHGYLGAADVQGAL